MQNLLHFANLRIVLLQLGWSTIEFYYYIWSVDYFFFSGGSDIYFDDCIPVVKMSSMRYAYWVVGFLLLQETHGS